MHGGVRARVCSYDDEKRAVDIWMARSVIVDAHWREGDPQKALSASRERRKSAEQVARGAINEQDLEEHNTQHRLYRKLAESTEQSALAAKELRRTFRRSIQAAREGGGAGASRQGS